MALLKKKKTDLRKDSVDSQTFHVGLELELVAKGDSERTHDDDACYSSRRDMYADGSDESCLRDHFSLSRDEAQQLAPYFNRDAWVDSMMESYSCDDEDCGYHTDSADCVRENLEDGLKRLTGNASFKVVSDGSVQHDDGETDAEVCWNYFASKDTLKDNAKILAYLKSEDCAFNRSCGLHVNLNNYLNVPATCIPTSELGFLFEFVAESRRSNTYCNKFGMSGSEKYSMIYNQGDRLEFRFFSPTMDAEKLNAYVTLANTVYRRLAGKKSKLPKKCANYLLNKMCVVNGLSVERAQAAIDRVNAILPASAYQVAATHKDESTSESEAA